MFNVTEKAQEQIREYFTGKDRMPIRVFLHQGGCGGPQLAMALDEKKDTDTVFTFDGVEYLVDSKFLTDAQPIGVDYIETGFKVTSSLQLGGGCSSCGTTGSCCS
jgi:iron-sulfur cluster assembly accessory protein